MVGRVLENGVRAALDLPDGWRWVLLTTEMALGRETKAMGIAFDSKGYAAMKRESERTGFYGLRDPDGRPQYAVLVVDGFLHQAVRREGVKPESHLDKLQALMGACGIRISRGAPPAYFGWARVTRRLIPLSEAVALLAAGPVQGDVDLSGVDAGDLPRTVKVTGDLNLFDCADADRLPGRMEVGGDLELRGRRPLSRLPETLKVGGTLTLAGRGKLASLPDGLEVGGNLELAGCESVTALPRGLKVGGSLDLTGCSALMGLPPDLVVDGDLWLAGCSGLRGIPPTVRVRGGIIGRDDLVRPGIRHP